MIVIQRPKSQKATYFHIWNNKETGMNLCYKCEHPLLYDKYDEPKLYSKMTGLAHKKRYYHGEPCKVCGKICGDLLYA